MAADYLVKCLVNAVLATVTTTLPWTFLLTIMYRVAAILMSQVRTLRNIKAIYLRSMIKTSSISSQQIPWQTSGHDNWTWVCANRPFSVACPTNPCLCQAIWPWTSYIWQCWTMMTCLSNSSLGRWIFVNLMTGLLRTGPSSIATNASRRPTGKQWLGPLHLFCCSLGMLLGIQPKKTNSGYKAWEYQLYVYGLCLVLLWHTLLWSIGSISVN